MSPRQKKPGQWLSITCPKCGKKGGQNLTHYEVLRCHCGKFYWALQPQRNGPLVLYPHPGFHPIPHA